MGLTLTGRFAGPAAGDTTDRQASQPREWLAHLQEVCDLLWPPPAVVTIENGGRPGWHASAGPASSRRPAPPGPLGENLSENFVLVPGIWRPPLLVPAARHLATASVIHFSGHRARSVRLGVRALSLALAGRLGGPLLRGRLQIQVPPGAETIEQYLRAVVSPSLTVSMYLGPARANRKPVLQLLSKEGRALAFAKIGVSPLTRELVQAESESLTRLGDAGLREATIPRVLHYGEWRGLNVLVLSALPVWQRHRLLSAERLTRAMTEVARVGGLQQRPLAGSAYLRQLHSRLASSNESPERETLASALGALAASMGRTRLTYGAWHGDWSPWNMVSTRRGLLVWDWERFTIGVPLGFDRLHYWLQGEIGPRRRDPLAVSTACPKLAPQLLAPLGIGAVEARLTAVLYLADLAIRYLADRQAEAGARLGAPGTWLIPALAREVEQLSEEQAGLP
jgi:hypothetical protein